MSALRQRDYLIPWVVFGNQFARAWDAGLAGDWRGVLLSVFVGALLMAVWWVLAFVRVGLDWRIRSDAHR